MSLCSSRFEDVLRVVYSVSAAVPAPQQLEGEGGGGGGGEGREKGKGKGGEGGLLTQLTARPLVYIYSLNVLGHVVDLGTVLVCNY